MDTSTRSTCGGFTCIVEGCGRPARAKTKPGKCGPCQAKDSYHRKNPDAPRRELGHHGKWKGLVCLLEGCDRKIASQGLCAKHYGQRYIPKQTSVQRRASRIKYRYGITAAQYDAMVEERGNCCDVCGRPPSKENTRAHWNGKLCIDHCHETKKVRGLLCNDCNLAVGYGKTPSILERAAAYLRLHG